LPTVYWGLWCQAASTKSRRAWVFPVLVIPPCLRESPLECSEGTGAEVGADAGAGEPLPVAELDGKRETGQRRDAAQAAQPPGGRGEL